MSPRFGNYTKQICTKCAFVFSVLSNHLILLTHCRPPEWHITIYVSVISGPRNDRKLFKQMQTT